MLAYVQDLKVINTLEITVSDPLIVARSCDSIDEEMVGLVTVA